MIAFFVQLLYRPVCVYSSIRTSSRSNLNHLRKVTILSTHECIIWCGMDIKVSVLYCTYIKLSATWFMHFGILFYFLFDNMTTSNCNLFYTKTNSPIYLKHLSLASKLIGNWFFFQTNLLHDTNSEGYWYYIR